MKQMMYYAMPLLLAFNLHFSSNTIPLLFNFLAIISREDEVQNAFTAPVASPLVYICS